MRLIKKTRVYLIILGVLFFAAGLVQAGGVVEEWVARYNGPANYSNFACAIAVDSSGNIYVTGDNGSDYATIKYDTNGNELWVRRYNGPGNDDDLAWAIAVDVSGNIYVTGCSVGSNTGYDYATIKYNPNGNELWVRRYGGMGEFEDDEALAIAVDGSGNVYVTGTSVGSDGSYDYATIKYDPNGNELWVRRYNGPGHCDDYAYAIAVDGSGNIYVTGSSGSAYATIKYDSAGNELWVRRYNNNGGATAIAVDSSGNIYVTGGSYVPGSEFDYATIKYDSAGNELWVRRYNANSEDGANAIAVDGYGNVYVTGESWGSEYMDDATIKYDSAGNEIWVRRYNGPGNDMDWAWAIAVDVSGNIYVTGTSTGSGTYDDYATIKYDSVGTQKWVARYNGPGNGGDNAYAIVVDSSGNVYVTGGSGGDYATIKYSQRSVADLNRDGNVKFADYAILALAWMSDPNQTNWNPACDISNPNDNIINMLDLVVFTDHWLECTDPNCD